MTSTSKLTSNQDAAATELGYIFTFLLGVLLMSMFSIWAWGIETNTRLRWNEEAIASNMNDIAAAVERADEASRLGDISYAEEVRWRPTEADESLFWLQLTEHELNLIDEGGPLDTSIIISGTGAGTHEGYIPLAGVDRVWVVYSHGITTIALDRPSVVQ